MSGDAGITGNNQDPVNWGPPNLMFSGGVESLTEVQYASNTNQTHVWSAESLWGRGRHDFTFGGDMRRQSVDVLSQQNARGEFSFTGALSGSDFADFLLGIPHTSADRVRQSRQIPPSGRVRMLYLTTIGDSVRDSR